jgi:L-alanine-DL-glutamate epimerase-like enolase superfamily enzyme
MTLNWKSYTLQFKHPFRIAHGVRSTTPVMFTRIAQDGVVGYGEASMPPYLGETPDTATAFFRKVHLRLFSDSMDIQNVMEYIDALAPGNTAAKAAIDIALHDLKGKLMGLPVYKLFGADPDQTPCTSYTIGMDSDAGIRSKILESGDFPLLKIKLGGDNDLEILEVVRGCTTKSISVDANQGWKDREQALDLIYRMKEMNVSFVEQPFDKQNIRDQAWLKERSPLPLIADESCQRLSDIVRCHELFDGINIKLMKCTGLSEARRMMEEAKKYGLQILIGCMSESSCAVSAAASLTPFAKWADLDGPLLISNDPFKGIGFEKGKIGLSETPGIGAVLREEVFGRGDWEER